MQDRAAAAALVGAIATHREVRVAGRRRRRMPQSRIVALLAHPDAADPEVFDFVL
jgi:hypothetical protein